MHYKQKKSQVCIITVVELISMGFWLAGIIILGVGQNKKCGSGCVEQSCYNFQDDYYYPCDCSDTCQNKSGVSDNVYKLGVALLIIGIIGSITGSILLCILRRKFYNMQPPEQVETIIVQGGMPLQGGVMLQQGTPVQYVQQCAPDYIYVQGMMAPQNYPQQNYPAGVNYGVPVQGQMPEQSNQK